MNNRKLINIVKGDIKKAIDQGSYARNTERNSNIEFDTKNKQILLDGVPYTNPLMVETTYNELRNLRDNNELIPGCLYRITDYNCTTTQENTVSAGNQFDIVVQAISNNILSEEGHAMMHPTDIYDVTFSDGVTKKCYIYIENGISGRGNVIDVDTMLGIDSDTIDVGEYGEFILDKENKTATSIMPSSTLFLEDLTYNYFQDSNLSAWKVWYSLDNDTSRFAWADDSVDEDSPASITFSDQEGVIWYRDPSSDFSNFYGWINADGGTTWCFTESETPNVGDDVFNEDGESYKGAVVTSYTPPHEGTGLPNGRGVIYRLIDEFNNDCPYDFKNIQFVRPLTDGDYDPEGEDTFVYTISSLDENENIIDYSLSKADTPIIIYRLSTLDGDLPNNVFFDSNDIICKSSNSITGISASGTIECSYNCVINMVPPIYLLSCSNLEVTDDSDVAIYIGNKKVLTEE